MRSIKQFFVRGLFMAGMAMCSWFLLSSTALAYPIDVAINGIVSDVSGPLSGRFALTQSMDATCPFTDQYTK